MSTITDFHSHILPGIDDGSADVKESIELLKMEAAQGITQVIATPHFYPRYDSPGRFLDKRQTAERVLRERMGEFENLPRLRVGAEVHYYPHMSNSEVLRELAIEGTDCVLIEMPTGRWTDGMYQELERITDNLGLTPIVAHVDRYISPFATHRIPQRLAELPVLVQANAGFFLRRSTAAMALRMLRHGQIHLLGSDCHNLTSRPPDLGRAVDVIHRRLGESALEWIRRNQEQVLSNP